MFSTIRKNWALTLSLFLFIALGAIFFPSAGRDDDHIAYWSANSLLEHGEIVNYNGERLEQGSSLGYVALITVVSGISRLRVPEIAVPTAIISGILLLFVLNGFNLFFDRRVVNFALLITATSFPFTYWSFSGLETSTYALTLISFCFVFLKTTQDSGRTWKHLYLFPIILVLQLLRPEAFFIIGLAVGLFWLLRIAIEIRANYRATTLIQTVLRSNSTRLSASVILANFIAFIPLLSFRYIYFGSFFPQPVLSKLFGIFPGLHSGIPIIPSSKYIIEFFIQNLVLTGSIVVLLCTVFKILSKGENKNNTPLEILVAFILSQFTFIMLSGPDWMEAFRFVAPIVPILSLLTALFFYRLCLNHVKIKTPLVAILICVQTAGFGYFVINDSSSVPLWATRNNVTREIPGARNYSWLSRANTHHLRDIPVVEALNATIEKLEPIMNDRPVVITSYQAGFVMYHVAKKNFGKIYFIDLVGLTDTAITKCPPLKIETQRLRDSAARKQQLGHLGVLRYLVTESGKAGTCFSPRPDIIYLMSEVEGLAPELKELGYEFTFNNTGDISLDFGKSTFYGGYLVDRDLFTKAGLKFKQSHISVDHQVLQ